MTREQGKAFLASASIFIACVFVILVMLTGCDDVVITPITTEVKKSQPEYRRPDHGLISFRTVSESDNTPCQNDLTSTYGCSVRTSDNTWQIYIYDNHDMGESGLQAILAHEFDHTTYGPEHK